MRECQWTEMKKRITFPETEMPRIFINDSQESLLAAIQREEVFGFILADVRTPADVRDRFGSFLFPPIIKRCNINAGHLSSYMKKVIEEEGKPLDYNTLVQVYNCKQELLMTPIVKLYLDRGMIVENVTKFFQYQAGRGNILNISIFKNI